MQISHVLHLLFGSFLGVLGARIESACADELNSASFAGSGLEEDCDTHCEDRLSVLEVRRVGGARREDLWFWRDSTLRFTIFANI